MHIINRFIAKLNTFHIAGLFAVLIIVNFGWSLGNGFALDDSYYIQNPHVANGISGFRGILAENTLQIGGEKYGYRPITALTFALEKQWFGKLHPSSGHLINLILYLLICILLFITLSDLLPKGSKRVIFWAVIIFLIHPIHSEVIYNIKCRDELLASLFGLGSLYCALRGSWQWLLSSLFLLIFGILSKPTALVFSILIPFSIAYFGKVTFQKALLGCVLCLLLIFVSTRLGKQSFIQTESKRELFFYENPIYTQNVSYQDRIPLALQSGFEYLKLHLIPYPLSSYYGFAEMDLTDFRSSKTWISLLCLLLLVGLALKNTSQRSIISFGIFHFLICLAFYCNFLKPIPGIIAERLVFVASIGFAISVSAMLNCAPPRKKMQLLYRIGLKSLIVAVILTALFWNWKRSDHWKNEISLLERDVSVAPESVKLHTLYANLLYNNLPLESDFNIKKSMLKEALQHYNKAIEIYPTHAHAWNNLGTLYVDYLGNYQEGLYAFERAVSIRPKYPDAVFGIGYCLEKLNQPAKALIYYEQAISLKSDFKEASQKYQSLKILLDQER